MSKLITIAGPTASGKSGVALTLAHELGGEVVSCDSVAVYRGFDIGAAKATADERARVPHHLIDVADWHEAFDAQRYRTLALAAIAGIRSRGKQPLLVGGTGLYLRALRYGLVDLPEADPSIRARLMDEEQAAPGSLYARLLRDDPASAARIEPNNLVYVARALEIAIATGEPASRVRARHGFSQESVPLEIVAFDWPPEQLRTRIAARSATMLQRGLLDEVQRLLGAGVDPTCRPMRAVGYRQACEVIRGEASRAGLEERISQATGAYAKRQRTWLRKEAGVRFVQVQDETQALERARALLRLGTS